MKLDRTNNAKRNIFFGIINRIVLILAPFITRVIIIRTLGAEYLGLDSLFTSILQVLNLTELGFSSAIVYCMYKPIADNDEDTLCALLLYFKKVYRVVGIVIFVVGICLLPFIRYFIHGSYPQTINIYVLYLLYLANTAISYFLFAYKSSLLTAYQRVDLISIINAVIQVLVLVIQIIAVTIVKNYYLYVFALIIGSVISNLCTAIITKKLFPNILTKGRLLSETKSELKKLVGGLMIQKFCQSTRNTFDSIFVSAFLGLTQVAMYNNYFYIMQAVVAMLNVICTSISAGVGNTIAMETKEKNYMDMKKFNFLYMWLSGWCTVCLACLYQPANTIFYGKDLLYPYSVVILFCLYFYTLKMGDIRSVYLQAAGLWWKTKHKALAETVANICLNYILGRYFGIYGIIIATWISLFFINFIWGSYLTFKYYFSEIFVKEYYLLHAVYASVTTAICIVNYYVCQLVTFEGIMGLSVKLIICMIIPNILYFIAYRRMDLFKTAIEWVLGIFKFEKINLFKINKKV